MPSNFFLLQVMLFRAPCLLSGPTPLASKVGRAGHHLGLACYVAAPDQLLQPLNHGYHHLANVFVRLGHASRPPCPRMRSDRHAQRQVPAAYGAVSIQAHVPDGGPGNTARCGDFCQLGWMLVVVA